LIPAFLVTLASAAFLAAQQPTSPPKEATPNLPDTAAGRQFAGWLAAYNTGRREALRQFVADQFAPPPNGTLPVDAITARHYGGYAATGGYEVLKVVASSADKITVAVRAKRTGFCTEVRTVVTPDPPHKILGFGFRVTEAPADTLPAGTLTEDEIRAKVDALVQSLVEADAFSGAILVARDGKPVYESARGLANRGWGVPNRIDTKFNVASLGKMFTAVAIAQLVERGKLSYQDTLEKVLPDYPDKEVARKITVHHLLTHTSGLGERPQPAEKGPSRRQPRSLKEYLPAFAGVKLKFEPGARFDYSNDGYLLLGAVIEAVSGRGYREFVRENVFQPAGMADTDSYDLETDPPHLATGYMDAPGGRRSNIFMLPSRGMPYGLGYSTVGDLVKFDAALRGNKLLSAQARDEMWEGKADRGPDSRYGYGFHGKRYNGVRVIGHAGGWVGINAHLDMYPNLGYAVAVLTNIDAPTNEIAYRLREWLTQGRQ
jgi:CubicO group peptidase (beta-lactamase class C family)